MLEKNELVPGNLASAHVIAARVTGADPKVLAAVIRGAVADQMTSEQLNKIRVPVLVLNGKGDVANQKTARILEEIPIASLGECEGDHHSTPYQPSFHQAVVGFLERQWRERAAAGPLSAHRNCQTSGPRFRPLLIRLPCCIPASCAPQLRRSGILAQCGSESRLRSG